MNDNNPTNPVDPTNLNPDGKENDIVFNESLTTDIDEVKELKPVMHTAMGANWIKIKDGKFVCAECENESQPEINTVEGYVKADTEEVKKELIEFPTKVTYGTCPFCGMEYVFRLYDQELYLEPSDLAK